MATEYQILQSGFIAPSSSLFVTPHKTDMEEQVKGLIINTSTARHKVSPYFYYPDIDDFYSRLVGNETHVRDFAFREEGIYLIKNILAETNLLAFLSAQRYNINLTNLHLIFLESLVDLYLTGECDESVVTWVGLLQGNNQSPNRSNSDTLDKLIGRLKDDLNSAYAWDQVVTQFMRWENGFSNMIIVFKIIYGSVTKSHMS